MDYELYPWVIQNKQKHGTSWHPDIHPHHAGKCNYNKYLLLLDLSPNPTLTQMSELRCQFLFVILSALLLLNVFFSTHVFFLQFLVDDCGERRFIYCSFISYWYWGLVWPEITGTLMDYYADITNTATTADM